MLLRPRICGFYVKLPRLPTIGRFADFTVLADDPRRVPADALLKLPVLMTVVGGQVTFDAANQD
jgi:hypothetical protein